MTTTFNTLSALRASWLTTSSGQTGPGQRYATRAEAAADMERKSSHELAADLASWTGQGVELGQGVVSGRTSPNFT